MRRYLSERFGRPVGQPRKRLSMILLGLAGIRVTVLLVYIGFLTPDAQTQATRQLDEVLSTFDPATRTNTQRFLRELGRGVLGRGQDLSEALDSAPDFLAGTQQVAGAIVSRPGAMASLIRGGEGAAAAADPVREPLAAGFAAEARAVRPFADREASLQRTLEVAPGALATVRAGLSQADPLVRELGGLGRTVRPALAVA